MQTSINAFNATLEKSNLWLKALTKLGNFDSEEQAYSALRAVLHALRDRLTLNEAVHIGAQLPILIRGVYYEGWKPSATPERVRTKEEFIDFVRHILQRASYRIDPERAIVAVFSLLNEKITEGEITDAKSMLPEDIRALWPL